MSEFPATVAAAEHSVIKKSSSNGMVQAPDITVEQGKIPDGYACTRTIHKDGAGQPVAEQWQRQRQFHRSERPGRHPRNAGFLLTQAHEK